MKKPRWHHNNLSLGSLHCVSGTSVLYYPCLSNLNPAESSNRYWKRSAVAVLCCIESRHANDVRALLGLRLSVAKRRSAPCVSLLSVATSSGITRLAPSLYSILPRPLSIEHYRYDRTNLKHIHQALALNRRHKNASKPTSTKKTTNTNAKMFSCANYERGCRGRCNDTNGRCDSCVVLNLQSTRSNSASSISSTNSRPAAAYSALTSSFASLSSAASSSQKAS
jgi:hypothetical protein